MSTSEIATTNNSPAPRRWLKPGLITAVLVVVAGLAWWFLDGGAAVTAQMQAQPATGDAASQLASVNTLTAAQPITGTLGAPGGSPPARPGARPANAAAAAPAAAVTPTTAASAALSGGIIAVAGMEGATIQPIDGSALALVKTGVRLTLLGRSADDRWLLASQDGATGWVLADAVIAFNTARLPVTDAMPPATVLVAPATTTLTAATTVEIAATDDADAIDAAPVTAKIDTGQTRGLNVRAGPGTAYARRGALGAADVVIVVGRTADGAWLEVQAAELDGGSGWASAYYLVVDGAIDSLPVTAPSTTTATTTDTISVSAASSTAIPISQSLNLSISNAAASALSGALAFQSGQGGTIYAYDLDNGSLWTLTSGFDPAISPDGQTVAFTRQGIDGGLYLIDIDGGNERRIYTGPLNIASPKWSEDGAAIVFSYAISSQECRDMGSGRCALDAEFLDGRMSDLDPNDYSLITKYEYDLGVVAADGSNFHSLSALHSSRAPDWSAADIVYQSSDGIQTIQDVVGASSQVVTYDMLQPAAQDPDWQPGGGRILMQRQGASHWEIWAVDANGGNMVALTQPRTTLVDVLPSNVAPAWSPDGSKIVFVSNREADGEAGAWRLWVMDADGGNQQQLPIDVEMNYTFGAEQMVSWGQ
jgi:Tol biopolymer transport system component